MLFEYIGTYHWYVWILSICHPFASEHIGIRRMEWNGYEITDILCYNNSFYHSCPLSPRPWMSNWSIMSHSWKGKKRQTIIFVIVVVVGGGGGVTRILKNSTHFGSRKKVFMLQDTCRNQIQPTKKRENNNYRNTSNGTTEQRETENRTRYIYSNPQNQHVL